MAERVHLLLLSPGGATETPFNRPWQGSNGMTKANMFAATLSTGSRTVAIHKRPVGATKE